MSHWQSKTVIRPTDTLFSKWVRLRDGKCMFAIRCYGETDFKRLHCCHYWGRGRESVRFDPENADAGCAACHDWIDSNPEGMRWHDEWKKKQLGQRAYDLLELRQQAKGIRDDFMMRLALNQMLKEQAQQTRQREQEFGSLA